MKPFMFARSGKFMICLFATSVFCRPFADDDSAYGGAGMDMDDPVGPGRIQCHEHSFAVRFNEKLFEGGCVVIVEPDDDHASVAGFTARVDGNVIAVIERFVIPGVVHAFSDDFQDESMLAVLEGAWYPFFGVARGKVVDRFRPVTCLNPGDKRELSDFVGRRPKIAAGRAHLSFGGRLGLPVVHVDTDAMNGFFTVEITHGYVERVCNGTEVFCCRIDFATANAADGGLANACFVGQLHLGSQMGRLFHELVKSFSNDFLGFSLHKACYVPLFEA